MNELFNPDKKFTQEDIGKLLNITSRQVRTLVSEGILPAPKPKSGYDALACIHSFITYKSKKRIPDSNSDSDIEEEEDLSREEQKLKLEDKRETIAMKRAKRQLFEKSYAPVDIIVETLQQVGGRLASRHDSLIPKMKIAYPGMPQEAVEVLESELAAAVNECSDILPDLSDYLDGDPNSMPSWLSGDETDTTNIR